MQSLWQGDGQERRQQIFKFHNRNLIPPCTVHRRNSGQKYRVCGSTTWIQDEETFTNPREGPAGVQRGLLKVIGRKKRTPSKVSGRGMFSEIRQYGMVISERGWVKAIGSEDNNTLKSQLPYLRHLHYFARYGDNVGRLSHQVRQGAAADHKVDGLEMLSGRSTVMDDDQR